MYHDFPGESSFKKIIHVCIVAGHLVSKEPFFYHGKTEHTISFNGLDLLHQLINTVHLTLDLKISYQ